MSACSILDIPNDILRRIILHLNARERVALGNSCTRFNSLVFEDRELLRDLDFSKQVHLTSETDVQQYFDNEKSREHVRRLNIRNIKFIEPGYKLENSIGKALNLVDIDIRGTQFRDIWQLGSFLNPLIHLQRLSVDWPEMKESNILLCCTMLEKPFSRLMYLSVKMKIQLLKMFVPTLRLCQKLGKLHVVVNQPPSDYTIYDDIWGGETKELKSLVIVQYCGPFMIEIKELFVTMLPDPEKWTDFQLNGVNDPQGFYLEKNVEVCEELLASKWTERISKPAWNHFNLGWVLFPEYLLKEVLRINYPNMLEDFCCLSTFMDAKRCLLTIKDAKLLLKNPRHPISYLYINHEIELGCDLHLVASAFPNLTTLVLSSGITRNLDSPLVDTNFHTRRKRRASAISQEQYESLNMDSSFKMLVQNTPRLRHFTLDGSPGFVNWDLEALYCIPGWKSLETLYLTKIPIKNGHFLSEIGKRCKNLQKIKLVDLGSEDTCCYKKELLQMLKHCENLSYVKIDSDKMGNVSEVLMSLDKNLQLRKVHVEAHTESNTIDNLISSMKHLLSQCSTLTTCILKVDMTGGNDLKKLESAVIRFKHQFSRPNLQIQIIDFFVTSARRYRRVGDLHLDVPDTKPFPHM